MKRSLSNEQMLSILPEAGPTSVAEAAKEKRASEQCKRTSQQDRLPPVPSFILPGAPSNQGLAAMQALLLLADCAVIVPSNQGVVASRRFARARMFKGLQRDEHADVARLCRKDWARTKGS
jgi:hypothetical protein